AGERGSLQRLQLGPVHFPDAPFLDPDATAEDSGLADLGTVVQELAPIVRGVSHGGGQTEDRDYFELGHAVADAVPALGGAPGRRRWPPRLSVGRRPPGRSWSTPLRALAFELSNAPALFQHHALEPLDVAPELIDAQILGSGNGDRDRGQEEYQTRRSHPLSQCRVSRGK